MTVEQYLALITSKYQNQPDFTAMVSADVGILVQIQTLLQSMIPLFDIDQAVGDQLDIIGKWVGVSRNIDVPISDVYFSWDEDASLGWDYGTWQPANAPTNVTVLPDDAYLTLLRAKIAANSWNGTTEGAYTIWEAVFPTFTILIQDYENMTYALCVVGGIIDSLTLALIVGGYIPLKPEAVLVAAYYVSTDTNPAFCWDVPEGALVAGWDEGSWLQELAPT